MSTKFKEGDLIKRTRKTHRTRFGEFGEVVRGRVYVVSGRDRYDNLLVAGFGNYSFADAGFELVEEPKEESNPFVQIKTVTTVGGEKRIAGKPWTETTYVHMNDGGNSVSLSQTNMRNAIYIHKDVLPELIKTLQQAHDAMTTSSDAMNLK